MKVRIGKFDEVPRTGELYAMFDGLCEDGVVFEDYERMLSSCPLLIVENKGEMCGFLTMDPNGPYIETHIYLLPSKRRVAVKLMRYAIDLAHRVGMIPMTSVSSDYPHIKRCLELLGLRVYKTVNNNVIKKGVAYDRFYLSHSLGE